MPLPVTSHHPAYLLLRWAWAGLDWLFPPICVGCKRPGVYLCPDCQNKIMPIPPPVCDRCGQSTHEPGLCADCQTNPPAFSHLRSWAWHTGPVRNAIHRLKYEGDLSLGEVFSRPLIPIIRDTGWDVDLVAPVPSGIARQAERGYNQAALLAWPVARACRLLYRPSALYKVRETASQVGLSRTQRRQNVEKAYQARADLVHGKKVLIIDDVATSGATLEACAVALLDSGASQVYGMTLSRTMFAMTDDTIYQEVQDDSAS